MLKNYFTIAWRNLRTKKGFSFINITGLAIGMAAAILIGLWVQNEFSFDKFHANGDSLFKVWNRSAGPGEKYCWDVTSSPVGAALKQEFPEIRSAARMYWPIDRLFNYGDKSLKARGNDVDKPFLTMFSFPLSKGDPGHALDEPNDIVLTNQLANRIFGHADPMDKLVTVNNKKVFKVTGVMKDLPNNTQFDFEYLVSLAANENYYTDGSWGNNSYNTYVQLQPNVSLGALDGKIRNLELLHDSTTRTELFLHPIDKWRLYTRFDNGKIAGGRIEVVRLLLAIAVIILLIACINFMNLSTAQSQKRAREVGVRKVMGAGRLGLINQFLSESILMSFIAGMAALTLVTLCLPGFNQLTGKRLELQWGSPLFWTVFGGFIFFTGLVAGSYPAFFLSSFQPVKVLKGAFRTVTSVFNPRKVLVVLQFSVAIVLVVATIVVYRQVHFAQMRDTGYNLNNLIEVPIEGDINKNFSLIKNDLLASGAATAICKTSLDVTVDGATNGGYTCDSVTEQQRQLNFSRFGSYGNFVSTMGIRLVEGRDLDIATYPSDTTACMLNTTAVAKMGIKDPVGKYIKGDDVPRKIVGVFKDFIINSPYFDVRPMIVLGTNWWTFNTVIRLNPQSSTSRNLQVAEQVFKKYNPAYPFTYQFVDKEFEQKYNDQKQTGTLAALFAGLTIFISCLGLFGLAAYMAEIRSKEIGIRKVLGASVASLVQMLAREFVASVVIAILIATPVAWWAMHGWLEDFTYRIEIGWAPFVLAGLAAILIAVLTVSVQAIKAALANPAKTIRTE